jgi:outer membrane protein assembly factor BamB
MNHGIRFALLGAIWTQALAGGDWPQWRGINRDGISEEKIATEWPAAGLTQVWEGEVGTGFSSVSVSRGRAYTMGNTENQDTIWCLDAKEGSVLWKHTYPAKLDPQYYEGGPGATPTVHGGRVYTMSKWGDVFCLDAESGKVVWQSDLRREGLRTNRWGFAGSGLIWGDLVIYNAGTAGVALNRNTGRIAWLNGTNAAGYASPVRFRERNRESVLIFGAKSLYALEPRTGKELWRYPFETGYDVNDTDPLIWREQVFLSSYSRGSALLKIEGGIPTPVYEKKTLHIHLSPGMPIRQWLFGFDGEAKTKNEFRCIDLQTGELKWSAKDPAFGSIIQVDGRLLVLSDKGELLWGEPSPEGFRPLARAKILSGTCWSPPALAHGYLYARNARGHLVCVDLRP